MAGSRPPDEASDAARWWRAYTLAESDQVNELRKLAAAGDDHTRRQLAGGAGIPYGGPDQAKLGEAIEVIRPLADASDDVAELWLARWLADSDRLDELRQRADRGSYHPGRLLARCLARHELLDELRQRADGGSHHAWRELVRLLADQDMGEELRELITSADGDTLLLIFDAVGGSPPGPKALRYSRMRGIWHPAGTWAASWPARDGWMSYASAPTAETNTPGTAWRRHSASPNRAAPAWKVYVAWSSGRLSRAVR